VTVSLFDAFGNQGKGTFVVKSGKGTRHMPLTPQDFVSKWKRAEARSLRLVHLVNEGINLDRRIP